MELMGIEPTTPGLQSRCSSQLSYVPGSGPCYGHGPQPLSMKQVSKFDRYFLGSARTGVAVTHTRWVSAADAVTFADVQAAAAAIAGQVVRTPSATSETLSELLGAAVVVKFENLQFTAAFKERGALNRLLALTPAERAGGVVAAGCS